MKESALSCKRAISEWVYVPKELRKLGKGVVDENSSLTQNNGGSFFSIKNIKI